MEFVSNEGKNVEISVGKDIYLRHAIKMRFIIHIINMADGC